MTDAPGTCHMVGCPQKGQHAPHGIGTGKWEDYATPTTCLGFPLIEVQSGLLTAFCSIDETAWEEDLDEPFTPRDMGELVTQHRDECTNRKASV